MCINKGITYIVAPYESDAQLTFLVKEGYADIAITEDSDLLVYGCKEVCVILYILYIYYSSIMLNTGNYQI